MTRLVYTFRAEFGTMVNAMKTQGSALRYWVRHAQGELSERSQTLRIFFDGETFSKAGFLHVDAWADECSHADGIKYDQMLAGALFEFIVCFLAHRLLAN